MLSKRKADRVREWEKIISTHNEGDVVKGQVIRKIKGGLLINIGVNVFLPASQVDIRRPNDIAEYIGQEIECMILKIDEARRNIVVSRRRLIEEAREKMKKALLSDLQIGQIRKGTVKNIADFGAFVDLGGIDGLLHITDMSWGRISHPTEMVRIDDEIEELETMETEGLEMDVGLREETTEPARKAFVLEDEAAEEAEGADGEGAFRDFTEEDDDRTAPHTPIFAWDDDEVPAPPPMPASRVRPTQPKAQPAAAEMRRRMQPTEELPSIVVDDDEEPSIVIDDEA